MSQPGICEFCHKSIVRARSSWSYHHPSYKSLANSAHRRCTFCKLLHEDTLKHQPAIAAFVATAESKDKTLQCWLHSGEKIDLDSTARQNIPSALYRWSVRSLGRTRESNFVVAVTFRVVPRLMKNESSEIYMETFGLPERVFYCFLEEDLGPLLNPVDLGRSTNPEVSEGLQIKKWIRKCSIEHKHCPKRTGTGRRFMPTRLLHVGGKRRGDPIRVIDTKIHKISGPYVTLSHCWGDSEAFRPDTLRSDTLIAFQTDGVPWNFLSRTFQEAIEVARFLEIDYIWIDSLCIIQGRDIPAVDDWNLEGSLMHKVYRNSYCNIAAADARDSTRGLFRGRKPEDVFSARFEGNGDSPLFGRKVWRTVREDIWDEGVLRSPLYSRGWVFQERMLAPRILHFCRHQLFWDCAEVSACESLPAGLPLPLDRSSATDRHWRGRLQEAGTNQSILLSGVNDDSIESFWKLAVENYTSLNLKFQSDKRRAIWGIAKLVRDSLDQEYAAGMWETALEEQLAWRVSDFTVAERPHELAMNPSWSWTSIKGRILFEGGLEQLERDYWVMDHAGRPLSFTVANKSTRAALSREPSETFQEELVAMSRDLELVEERRRKSSASSRRQSLTRMTISKKDSQIGTGSPDLSKNTSIGDRKMSPQQMIFEMEAKGLESGNAMRRTSEVNASKDQDMEPELLDKRIAIQAPILQGWMRSEGTNRGWTIELAGVVGYKQEDFAVDAFPDVKRDAVDEPIHFVILALTEQFERHVCPSSSDESLTAQNAWYTGPGLMLQPTGSDECYVRTGALKVRRLSMQLWDKICGSKQSGSSKEKDVGTSNGVKFFII